MSQLNTSDTLPPGTLLGRYEIRRLLGRGGMGCVYEAVHRDLKKRVAIKTLLPSLAANQDARTRFLREGESASRIRHPHVVDVTDVGAEGTTSYLVMEYLEGEDLSKLIARQGPLSPGQTVDIMLPVAAAISAAHDMGVIHRDLKPENVFLANSSMGGGAHPKVLDFGISKVTGDRATMVLTGTGAMFGTTFYLPPEQIHGARQADAKSDQYALGTILYECVTGHRAFEGENLYAVLKDIAEGRYEAPRSRRPDLPASFEAVIVRALSLDPAERFDSVKDLGAALLEFANPHARVLWASFFGGSPVGDPLRFPQSGAVGGTMILPTGAADAVRRAITPPPRSGRGVTPLPSPSTLRHANGESLIGTGNVPNLRRSRAPFLALVGAVAVGGGVIAVMQLGVGGGSSPVAVETPVEARRSPPVERKTFRVEVETDPREAKIELDGRPVGAGMLDERIPTDGAEHVLVVRAPGYRDMTVRFTDHPPPHLLTLDRAVAPSPPAAQTTPNPVRGSSASADDTPDKPDRRHRDRPTGTKTSIKKKRDRGDADGEKRGTAARNPNGAPIIY